MALCGAVLAAYLFLYRMNFGVWRGHGTPVHLTLHDALLAAPFLWWASTSLFACLVVILFAIPRAIIGGARWIFAKRRARPEIQSPPRRQFLERTASVVAAAPFVAGAYGLLYGRLNLETTNQTIRLKNLPRAFEGFRICQLSDIHIGPFMPAEEIRKYVAIANAQKAEMVVLTGDFVTFDPNTQQAVVEALSGLRGPFGVYGSLGNHDAWAGVEDSITELFRQTGVTILRGANVPVAIDGESVNLIGVDFQSVRRFGPSAPVRHLLRDIEGLDTERIAEIIDSVPATARWRIFQARKLFRELWEKEGN
jgi:hypothetical protein